MSLDETLYHTIISENALQSSGQYVLTAGLSRPLVTGESVFAVLLGTDVPFQIDNTLTVTSRVEQVEPGRYTFDVNVAVITSSGPLSLVAPAVVDVTSQGTV